MTYTELETIHAELCNKARAIMKAKNHDYTDGSKDPFANFRAAEILDLKPEMGVLLRIQDKIMRLKTFVNQGTLAVQGESADDAITDIINYLVLLKGLASEKPA